MQTSDQKEAEKLPFVQTVIKPMCQKAIFDLLIKRETGSSQSTVFKWNPFFGFLEDIEVHIW